MPINFSSVNNKQWTVLIGAVAFFCVSEVIPPWLFRCDWGSWESLSPAGYHFLLKAPEAKAACTSSDPLPGPLPDVLKNSRRLNVQRTILVFLMAGLLLLLRDRRTNFSGITGLLAVCISIVGLLFLGLMIRLGI